MNIADVTVNPEGWTGLVTAITGMLTALGILVHAILSAVRGQKLDAEVKKNTQLTWDVAGKADVAAEKAAIAAVQTQQVSKKVDQMTAAVTVAAVRAEDARSDMKEIKASTQILKDALPPK